MTTGLPTKWENPVAPTGFPCRFCKTKPLTTAPLKIIHEKRYHEKKYAEAEAAKDAASVEESASEETPDELGGHELVTPTGTPAPTEIAGIAMDSVHELTRKFAGALQSTAPDMTPQKKATIIRNFDDNAHIITQDPTQIDRFLIMSQLSNSQSQFIKLTMEGLAGMNVFGNQPQQAAGQTQAMTFDPRTGQMVSTPIFMLNSGGAPAANQAPMYFMPPAQNNDSEVARKLDQLIEKLSERAAPAPAPQPTTPIRRYQRPAQTEGGDTVLVWVEEPVDPLNNTLAQLKDLGIIGRQEVPVAPASPEAIGEAVAVKLEKLIPADNGRESDDMKELRDEMRGSREDFKEYVHQTQLKETERNAQETAMATFELKMKPFIDDLQRELRENRSTTGLSDHQAELRHQGDLVSKAVNGLNSMVAGLRSDLQPLAMSNMMGTMKTMGISDNQIADVIRHMQTQSAAASPEQADQVAASMSKWMNEG